jgi:inactivated superfamily I helicase
MGVLESRVLDLTHVIVTSMNEGKFPAENLNSFIPYDVRELGLPTFKERRHLHLSFYHLLQRAKTSICFITLKVKVRCR